MQTDVVPEGARMPIARSCAIDGNHPANDCRLFGTTWVRVTDDSALQAKAE